MRKCSLNSFNKLGMKEGITTGMKHQQTEIRPDKIPLSADEFQPIAPPNDGSVKFLQLEFAKDKYPKGNRSD